MNIHCTHTPGIPGRWAFFAGAALALALMTPTAALSVSPASVNLRSTAKFAVLAGSLISNIPASAITGDIGLSPAAGSNITGFGTAEVTGTIFTVGPPGPEGSLADASGLTEAKGDLTLAYNDAAGRVPEPTGGFLNPGSGNVGGMTLVPGLYKFSGGAAVAGSDLTLAGGADDVWIFQIASDLNVGSGIQVILSGGARAANVFWQVGTSAILGTTSAFKGTILADQSISLNTGATLEGRALASIAAVTLASNAVTRPAAVSTLIRIEAGKSAVLRLRPASFQPGAGIGFMVPADGKSGLRILDARGRAIATAFTGSAADGSRPLTTRF
ncbi:MAG TPA: ice-binding family protein [Fibrobacteria bacterium]|nr:ice-binding family protein [Fibrobacteria bacterium]